MLKVIQIIIGPYLYTFRFVWFLFSEQVTIL